MYNSKIQKLDMRILGKYQMPPRSGVAGDCFRIFGVQFAHSRIFGSYPSSSPYGFLRVK